MAYHGEFDALAGMAVCRLWCRLTDSSPRILPYQVTVASITLVFLMIMMWLIMMRQLLPGIVIVGSFMCFVLWVAGLVQIGIELYGPGLNINQVCITWVNNAYPAKVQTIEMLAWITQKNICT